MGRQQRRVSQGFISGPEAASEEGAGFAQAKGRWRSVAQKKRAGTLQHQPVSRSAHRRASHLARQQALFAHFINRSIDQTQQSSSCMQHSAKSLQQSEAAMAAPEANSRPNRAVNFRKRGCFMGKSFVNSQLKIRWKKYQP